MNASAKDILHRWVDGLEDQDAARLTAALQNEELLLAEYDDEPLTAEDVAAMKRGSEDLKHGRSLSLQRYRRSRGV